MKYTKRILSLLLSLTLVLGLLPAGVLAADNNSITVYVSVSKDGAFVTGKNDTGIAYVPVEVTSPTPTINDAFVQLHETYYNGDSEAPYVVNKQGGITSFWGNSAVPEHILDLGYYLNNVSAYSPNDEIEDGDTLSVFFYQDATVDGHLTYYDCYSYFENNSVVTQQDVATNFTLYRINSSDSTRVKIDGNDGENTCLSVSFVKPDGTLDSDIGATVNESGQFSHTFTSPDTYYLTVTGCVANTIKNWTTGETYNVSAAIVPPLCKVTVLSAEDYAAYESAQKYVDEAKAQLTWNTIKGSNDYSYNVTSNPTLPSKITVDGKDVAVAWTTDDTSGAFSISSYGPYVNRPAKDDTACNLIATLTYNGATATKIFPIVIKAEGVNDKKESVVNYGDLMSGIAAGYSTSTDPWVILEKKAYDNSAFSGTMSGSPLANALASSAIGKTPELDSIKVYDYISKNESWNIPYALLAYDAAGVDTASGYTNTREQLKDFCVNILNTIGESTDAETVAPCIAALANYYHKNDSAVDTAVDKGITWLSQQQNSDGTFSTYGTSNSNTTAMVIVALASVGIDAHTDSRFVKNYKSAIEGLLTFALADHSGFGYKGNVTFNAMSTEQGFRALVAYARYKESSKAYNIYLQAKDSKNTVSAPDISATVVPSTPSNPEKQIQVSATVDALGETWATGSYTVKANTTVGVVLNKLFAANGITCVGLDVGYISSVTKNGVTLKEKDKGTGSGWMYRVNGVMPNVGVNDYKLSDGDTISFFYTTDYTKEDGAQQDTSTTTTPAFSDVSAGSYYADAVEWAVKKGITVGTSDTTFSPDDNCTREQMAMFLWKAAGSPEPKQTGANFTDLPGGSTAKAMLWVAEQNITSGTSDTTFSPETTCTRAQMAAFLYRYAGSPAVSGTCAFADVSAEAYYHDAVLWCVHQSITAGTGGEKFSPDAPCTRGQMVTFLYRFLGNHS